MNLSCAKIVKQRSRNWCFKCGGDFAPRLLSDLVHGGHIPGRKAVDYGKHVATYPKVEEVHLTSLKLRFRLTDPSTSDKY